MKQDSSPTITNEQITCHACLTRNSRAAAFCRKCGTPIGAVATIDPLQSIQAEGFLLRKATEGRPKPIILLGIWILHLPVLVGCIGVAIYLILNQRGWGNFVFFWGAVGVAYLAFMILYRTTKNYLKIPEKTWRNSQKNPSDEGVKEL